MKMSWNWFWMALWVSFHYVCISLLCRFSVSVFYLLTIARTKQFPFLDCDWDWGEGGWHIPYLAHIDEAPCGKCWHGVQVFLVVEVDLLTLLDWPEVGFDLIQFSDFFTWIKLLFSKVWSPLYEKGYINISGYDGGIFPASDCSSV